MYTNNRNQKIQDEDATSYKQLASSEHTKSYNSFLTTHNTCFNLAPPHVKNAQSRNLQNIATMRQQHPDKMSPQKNVKNPISTMNNMPLSQLSLKVTETHQFQGEGTNNQYLQGGTSLNYKQHQGETQLVQQYNRFDFQKDVSLNIQNFQGCAKLNSQHLHEGALSSRQLQRLPSNYQHQQGELPPIYQRLQNTAPRIHQNLQVGAQSNHQHFHSEAPPSSQHFIQGSPLHHQNPTGRALLNYQNLHVGTSSRYQQLQVQAHSNHQQLQERPPVSYPNNQGEVPSGHSHIQGGSKLNFTAPQFTPHCINKNKPPVGPPLNPLNTPNFQQQVVPQRGASFAPISNLTIMPPPDFINPPPPIIKGHQSIISKHISPQTEKSDHKNNMPLHATSFPAQQCKKTLGSQLVNQWLRKNEQLRKGKKDKTHILIKEKDTVKLQKNLQCLAEMKTELTLIAQNIAELEMLFSEADSAVWERKTTDLEKKKDKFKTMIPFLNMGCSVELKKCFPKNKKKRVRLKKARKLKYELQQTRKEKMNINTVNIDKWQQTIVKQMKEQDMNEKRKVAADKTLSKVSKDIQDANRLVETMKALEKLRLIRRDAAEKRGDTDLGESRDSFEQKITDMTRLVQAQLEHYRTEEARLKVIIKSEVEEDDRQIAEYQRNAELLKQRAEEAEIEAMLFGAKGGVDESHPLYPYDQYYKQADHSLPLFVQLRQSWDAFLVPEHLPGGSGIPPQWVFPEEPGSLAWAKLV